MMQAVNSTIDRWDHIKLKSFCKAKYTVNSTKQQPKCWERSFTALYPINGSIYKINQDLDKIRFIRVPNNPIKNEGQIETRMLNFGISNGHKALTKCSTYFIIREMYQKDPEILAHKNWSGFNKKFRGHNMLVRM